VAVIGSVLIQRIRVVVGPDHVWLRSAFTTEVVARRAVVEVERARHRQHPSFLVLDEHTAVPAGTALDPRRRPGQTPQPVIHFSGVRARPVAVALGLDPARSFDEGDEVRRAFLTEDGRLRPLAYAYAGVLVLCLALAAYGLANPVS
jgi:hypothetical protein